MSIIMSLIRYQLLGFSPNNRKFIKHTLDDPRGHANNGFHFKQCRSPHTPYVIIRLTPRNELAQMYSDTSLKNLSITDYSKKPIRIYIDDVNWHKKPSVFTGSQTTYRQYLIQHEMGHALGILKHDHPIRDQTYPGKCPVMYQQTKGTSMCKPNPWLYPKNTKKITKKSSKRTSKRTSK